MANAHDCISTACELYLTRNPADIIFDARIFFSPAVLFKGDSSYRFTLRKIWKISGLGLRLRLGSDQGWGQICRVSAFDLYTNFFLNKNV